MKKIIGFFTKTDERKKWTGFVLMTFVFSLAIYAGSPSRGFVSALPVFFFAALAVFLFYDGLKQSLLVTAVVSLAVTLADASGFDSVDAQAPTLRGSLVRALFFVLTSAAAYLAARMIRKKKLSGYIRAAAVAALYLVCFNAISGNIFGALASENEVREYLASTYPMQKIDSYTTYYDFRSHDYATGITFRESRRNYYGEEKVVPGDNYDGYFLYAKNAVFEYGRSAMTDAVRREGVGTLFTVEPMPFRGTPERGLFDLGDDISRAFPYMSYKVIIQDDLPDIDGFSAVCSEFAAALARGGFVYDSVTFYGGEKGVFMFEALCEYPQTAAVAQPFDDELYQKTR